MREALIISVPTQRAEKTDSVLPDELNAARVVIKPRGFIGLGRPIFVRSYEQGTPLAPDERVRTVRKSKTMWYVLNQEQEAKLAQGEMADYEVPIEKINGKNAVPALIQPEDV